MCNNQPIIVKQKAICNILTHNNYEVDNQVSWDVEVVDEEVIINIPKKKEQIKFDQDFIYNIDKNSSIKELSQKYSFLLS